jgi:hypothetical protein
VIFSERFFVGRECGLAAPERFGRIAVGQEQAREIVTHAIRVRMAHLTKGVIHCAVI